MKQHITIEQLNELSDMGREGLYLYLTERNISINCSSKESIYGNHEKKLCKWCFVPLNIGQMIEFLGLNIIYLENEAGWWGIKMIEDKSIDPVSELSDALWEAVKEVLEKHKELVEEAENGHDVQCSSGVGLDCDCWKLKDVKSHLEK